MSEFKGQAKSLAECYVYYNYLDQHYPTLKGYVMNAFNRIDKQARKASQQVGQLRSMAAAEAQKEQMLLNKIFKVNIVVDLQNEKSISELISTINNYMNLKDAFNANIQMIQDGKAEKILISYFPKFFQSVWSSGNYENLIVNHLNSVSLGMIETEAEKVFTQYFHQATEEAIKQMLNSEYTKNDTTLKPYQELLQAIGRVGQTGSLAQQLYNIYGLEKLKQSLLQNIAQGQGKDKLSQINDLSSKANGMVQKNMHAKAGQTLSAVTGETLSLVVDQLTKAKNIKLGGVTSVPNRRIKANNIMTLNVDPKHIEDALQNNKASNRQQAVGLFNNIYNKIKDIDDGFIVYTSDFNRAMNNRKGFSAGTMNAENYRNLFGNIENNIDTFIGAMMQLGSGAIGEGQSNNLESIIAQNVAYLLFDDFDAIGNVGNTNAIHVMNLNGVLIPLSFILTMLANAIESVEDEADRVVRVRISSPAILFKSFAEEQTWVESNSPGNYRAAWDTQREHALKNTKITTQVLLNFRQLIEQYGKSI